MVAAPLPTQRPEHSCRTSLGGHLTYSLTGSNIGMWYHGGTFSNVNENNIPGSEYGAWIKWSDANWQK
jgi:hypothetical protein